MRRVLHRPDVPVVAQHQVVQESFLVVLLQLDRPWLGRGGGRGGGRRRGRRGRRLVGVLVAAAGGGGGRAAGVAGRTRGGFRSGAAACGRAGKGW